MKRRFLIALFFMLLIVQVAFADFTSDPITLWPRTSPPLPNTPYNQNISQYWPKVATNGDSFLVIWYEAFNTSQYEGWVASFASRFSKEGRNLDPNGILIANTMVYNSNMEPAVCSVDKDFWVFYNNGYYIESILARKLDPNGNISDTFVVGTAGNTDTLTSLAADCSSDENILVAWMKANGIYYSLLNKDGQNIINSMPLILNKDIQYRLTATTSNSTFLVVFGIELSPYKLQLNAIRVDSVGNLLDNEPIIITEYSTYYGNYSLIDVIPSPNGWLVVYDRGPKSGIICGRYVDFDRTVSQELFSIENLTPKGLGDNNICILKTEDGFQLSWSTYQFFSYFKPEQVVQYGTIYNLNNNFDIISQDVIDTNKSGTPLVIERNDSNITLAVWSRGTDWDFQNYSVDEFHKRELLGGIYISSNPPIKFDPNFPDSVQIQYSAENVNEQDHKLEKGVLTYIEAPGNSDAEDTNDVLYTESSEKEAKIVSIIAVPISNPEQPYEYKELSRNVRSEEPNESALVETTIKDINDSGIYRTSIKFWLKDDTIELEPDAVEQSFSGKTLTIQQSSSDPNIEYPLIDIKNALQKDTREISLGYVITPNIELNVFDFDPNLPITISENNLPNAYFDVSTKRKIGDIDGDGIVDYNDYDLLLADLGKKDFCRTDIASVKGNGIPDGFVNEYDRKAFVEYWTQDNPGQVFAQNQDGFKDDFQGKYGEGGFKSGFWTLSQEYPWEIIRDSNFPFVNFIAKSGPALNRKSSTMKFTVNCARPGKICFDREVSTFTGSNTDKFEFYINGQLIDSAFGQLGWKRLEYPISAGLNEFEFRYKSYYSSLTFLGTIYIDNVEVQIYPQ